MNNMDRNRLLEDLSLICDCSRPLEFTGRNAGGYDIYHCPACKKEGRKRIYRLPEDPTNFIEYRDCIDGIYRKINMRSGDKNEWKADILNVAERYNYTSMDPQFSLLEMVCYTNNFSDAIDLRGNYNYVNDRYEAFWSADEKNVFPLNLNGVTMLTGCKRWLEKDMKESEYATRVRSIYNRARSYENVIQSKLNFKGDVDALIQLDTIHNKFTKEDPVYHLAYIIVHTQNFGRRISVKDEDYLEIKDEFEMIRNKLRDKVDPDDEVILSKCERWLEKQIIPKEIKIAAIVVALSFILIPLLTLLFVPRDITPPDHVGGISVHVNNKAFAAFSKWNVELYAKEIDDTQQEHATATTLLLGISDSFKLYDISFLSNKKVVQPNGIVEVTMDIPEGFYAKNVAVYHIDVNGKCEVVDYTIMEASNTVVFRTDHFSLYAIVDRPVHVNFSDSFGSQIPEQKINKGGKVENPGELYREGYDFIGWYYGDRMWNFAKDTVSEDMILTAKWSAHTYTIVYDGNKPASASGSIENLPDNFICHYDDDLALGAAPTLEGWKFGGWYEDKACTEKVGEAGETLASPNLATEGTVTLYAKWTPVVYTVVYDGNKPEGSSGELGGILNTPLTCVYDEGYTLADAPTLKGWTFLGWYRDKACTDLVGYANDHLSKPNFSTGNTVILYAKWKVNSYTVTFDSQGGECDVESKSVTFDSAYGDLPEAKKPGNTFLGWFTSPDSGNKVLSNDKFTFDGDITLYAHYSEHVYTVGFDTMGGSYVDSQGLSFGECVKMPEAPYKEGYTFAGWYTNPEYEKAYNFEAKCYESLTLYAKWEANTYKVVYDGNKPTDASGEVISLPSSADWTYDSNAMLASEPSLIGWTFCGWYKDAACTERAGDDGEYLENPNFAPQGSVTLYAKWVRNNYVIIYDANGGEGTTENSSHSYDCLGVLTENAYTRVGYVFGSWNTQPDGSGTSYSDKESVKNLTPVADGVATLYAQWVNNIYTVNYASNNGIGTTESSSHTYDVESGLTKNAFTRVGYTFSEWNTLPDGSGKSYSDEEIVMNLVSDPKGEITLYAQWDNNVYTVIYDSNCNTGATDSSTHVYDVERGLKSNSFINVGYTFTHWSTQRDGSGTSYSDSQLVKNLTSEPDGSVILYAQWTLNTCKLLYDLNDTIYGDVKKSGTTSIVSHNVNVLDSAKATTYESHYKFDGWFTKRSGGVQLTDGTGKLLKNVTGYTDKEGRWISEDKEITLYARWSQTKEGTYIVDATGFASINNKLSGKFVLINDIDISTVGVLGNFSGELDGNGYKLYSWSYKQISTGNIGIFRSNLGNIYNLRISNCKIYNTDPDTTGILNAGILCGENTGTITNVTISNCSISVDVGNLNNSASQNYIHVGGISGKNSGTISDCTVSSSTLGGYAGTKYEGAEAFVGGVVGYSVGGSVKNIYSQNNKISCTVKANADKMIVCWNHGRPRAYVAGLIGYSTGTQTNAQSSNVSGNSISYELERSCSCSSNKEGAKSSLINYK